MEPSYVALWRSGELAARAARARARLADCDLCGRLCHVDRRTSLRGVACRTGPRARVDGHGPHFGEEAPLTGSRGSGTIFFSGCNLRCDFCQNWTISQTGGGAEVDAGGLADLMLELEAEGCHNVNLVSPSHVVAPVLEAVEVAASRGLRLPLVYNTGGYDSPAALALLDGVVDVYMPDMKYGDAETARRYSHVKDYPRVNQAAVREMHRQVGDLALDARGLAVRGLLVRHLVLPNGLAGTRAVLEFLAREISQETYVNLMDQYRPCFRAPDVPALARSVSRAEWEDAVAIAAELGLGRLDGALRTSRRAPRAAPAS